jgi:hypothetical protein
MLNSGLIRLKRAPNSDANLRHLAGTSLSGNWELQAKDDFKHLEVQAKVTMSFAGLICHKLVPP